MKKTLWAWVALLFAATLCAMSLGAWHRDEDVRRITRGVFTFGLSETAREP